MALPKVIILEDDAAFRAELVEALEDAFDLRSCGSVANFLTLFAQFKPALVVLDMGLPDGRGGDIIQLIRAEAAGTGVLVVSGQQHETDRIVALELGADDFLTKPCGPRELIARGNAILRRAQPVPAEPPRARTIRFAGFTLDLFAMELTDETGTPLTLTTAEFDLLKVLIDNPQRVLSREQITTYIRGDNWAGYDRTIDGLVYRLRKKLKSPGQSQPLLKTVHGAGYIFTPQVER